MAICRGGCGAKTTARYCRACSPTNNPAYRSQRARHAQRFAMEAYQEALEAQIAGLPPRQVYRLGYKAGYYLAYRRWKRWAEKAIRRNQAA